MDGDVVDEVEPGWGQTTAEINRTLSADATRWVAAAAACRNGAVAHTSPVYVVVEGRPSGEPEVDLARVEERLRELARFNRTPGNSEPTARQLERARAVYHEIESGITHAVPER